MKNAVPKQMQPSSANKNGGLMMSNKCAVVQHLAWSTVKKSAQEVYS